MVDVVRDRVWRFDHSPTRALERQQSAVRTLERAAVQQFQRTPEPQRAHQQAPQRGLSRVLGLLAEGGRDDAPHEGAAFRAKVLAHDHDQERGIGW